MPGGGLTGHARVVHTRPTVGLDASFLRGHIGGGDRAQAHERPAVCAQFDRPVLWVEYLINGVAILDGP